jgi:alpha-beta hydrolase superfamily lysophospholipase
MSDSPYSMRNLALTLHEHGASVVGLRVPGHGTAPSGLVKVRWQDMAAAVRLAMQHVRDQAGDKPVVLIGYSNGGALALEYALTAIQQDGLRRADGIVLISPAVGVTKLAAFAVWQGRLGRITTLDKLAWNSISLEFDPYKYSSFAVNAGDQTFRLTTRIQSQLEDLRVRGSLYEMPPVLAFQSALDATVSTPALVNRLFRRLSEGDHELVVFDVNRTTTIQSILVYDPRAFIENLLKDESLPFTMRLITNRKDDREDVMEVSREPGRDKLVQRNLPYSWPDGVFSLSHVALPFPEDDPLYGRIESELNPGYQLGGLELRGERGMSRIGESRVLRLHWNPFYDYLAQRVVDFVKAPPAGE